jgi:hypothetical protein
MKTEMLVITLGGAVVATAIHAGLIGFTYPRIVENEPLHTPVRVLKIENTVMTLEDGRKLEVQSLGSRELEAILKESHGTIDIETNPKISGVVIYANRDGWVCGTPWARPLTLRLIPETVYKNRREFVDFGAYLAK